MATRLSTEDVASAGGPRAADGRANHHRLVVLAASAAEVVGQAGGWLFDRARAGWDVNVRVESCGDLRALAILGADTLDDSVETILCNPPRGGALAVSATLLRDDPSLRAQVSDVAKSCSVELLAWGEDWPVELGRRVEVVPHQLSVAARAFKARALGAAGLEPGVGPTEILFELTADVLRPLSPV
ncbi:hypothetical protein A5663_17145 [Mycobacterium sp. E740]|nr:hypothetical protein A5663_17145 [Mycobacterium sp. E740]